MGGNAGIVTPDFVQQYVSADDVFARPEQVLQDRCFLFRQPDFAGTVFRVDHDLRGGPERIRTDRENRILAAFVLTQLSPNPGKQHAKLEGFGDIIIGA